jgi:hypothetical protein
MGVECRRDDCRYLYSLSPGVGTCVQSRLTPKYCKVYHRTSHVYHSFALALMFVVGACSIKKPAKNFAIPSKSSKVVTTETSIYH